MVEKKAGTFSQFDVSEEMCDHSRDIELVSQAIAGSKTAFEQIVAEHQGYMYKLAFRFFNNEEDTLDAVQEIFLKAFRSLRSFEGRSSLRTWLYRIASNTCMTLAKNRNRAQKSLIQSILDWFSTPPPPDPAKTVIRKEYQVELQKAINDKLAKIPEVYRLPLILKDLEGKSLEEISEILEIPDGTVKSRINRGRRLLQESLEPFFRERAEV